MLCTHALYPSEVIARTFIVFPSKVLFVSMCVDYYPFLAVSSAF